MRTKTVAQTVLVAALVASPAAGRNISVDAITRATTYHSHEGDVAVLTDGRLPDGDEATPAFVWNTQGILVFEWSDPLPLIRVRVYAGAIGNDYVIRSFVGGRLNDEGTLREPAGLLTANAEEYSRATNGWTDTVLPEGTVADNIELLALGPIELYDVEILVGVDETAVRSLQWSEVKGDYRTTPDPKPRR